ncbi:MAG: hypothetical protein PUD39_02820 [Bacteroidales bacterium]|nr:hypothetical protein [Bacteroidales bacterium]
MKKSSAILSLTAAASLTLTGCLTYPPATIVDGGPGWFPGDYAPYYWSDYHTPPPPPPPKPHHPDHGPHHPDPGHHPDHGHKPGKPDPGKPSNPPGSRSPGSPQQGGYRGQK